MSTSENTSRIRYVADERIPSAVKIWLIAGLFMVFMQIVIGGVTRLTGSGLSITRWEVVTGTLPPLSEADWAEAFDLYKATPQYEKINQGMSLSDFKFIFFWEYFHRLWARLMFFVFIIPFGWFLWKGMFSRRLLRRLPVVMLLAGLEGFFGWIMVASGLRSRPWVNAYNLTLHLVMGLVIFSYLLWTIYIAYQPKVRAFAGGVWKKYFDGLVLLAFVQIGLGAMMSGTKAGLFYPTWPDQGGTFLPSLLLNGSLWSVESFTHYDTNPFVPALIQFLHRNTAYLLTAFVLYAVWKMAKQNPPTQLRTGNRLLVAALFVQVVLGIVTLLQCQGSIPVTLGVLHQAGAVVLLSVLLFVAYQVRESKDNIL
ncbi:MAG: COX15/CtaA family protein [Saprospiraceae bacterium]|nr:COX15/CtaA family protein [Saprospiraceae bacterium]